MGKITRKLRQIAYVMKVRKAAQECTNEQLELTLEEIKKEIDRRNKKK